MFFAVTLMLLDHLSGLLPRWDLTLFPFKEKDFMSVLSVLNDFHDTENKT